MSRAQRAIARLAALAVALGGGAVLSDQSAAAAPPIAVRAASGAAGGFYPVTPERLLDTRTTGYAVGPAAAVTVPVLRRAGVPAAGVSAVVVNLTATQGSVDSELTAYASDAPRVAITSLAFRAGSTRSGLVTVPVGADGAFSISNANGQVHVLADVVGFYAADDTVIASNGPVGGYQPVQPVTLLDTRTGPPGPIAAGGQLTLNVDLGAGVNPHVTALAVRLLVHQAGQPGSLVAWNAGGTMPSLPSVSYGAGETVSNLAIVRAATNDRAQLQMALSNLGSAAAEVTAELVGFYDDGQLGPNLRYRPVPPTRIVDTRSGVGTGSIGPGAVRAVASPAAVAGDNTFGLVGTMTVLSTSEPTSVGVAAHMPLELGQPADAPAVGRLEVGPGGPTSVPLISEVDPANRFDVANRSGQVDLVIDVTGSFEAQPPSGSPTSKSWVHAVAPWQVTATAS